MDAARKPATAIFQGGAGTMAANIRMTGPIQVIIGSSGSCFSSELAQCITIPITTAESTM